MPKVSIVVPIYNVEKYLGELLDSLVHQTFTDLEIILVDDGSPDNCGKICDEYAARDKRVKVIHKANGGVGAARNDGLNAATGEWVILSDSDDWLELDAIEKLLNSAQVNGADVAIGDIALVYGANVINSPLYREAFVADSRESIDKLIAAAFSRNYCFDPPAQGPGNGGYGSSCNKLVKRELLVQNKIHFDLKTKGNFDDIIYTVNVLANAHKVVYIPENVYNYRQIESSITKSAAFKPGLLDINQAIFDAWQEFMDKYGADGRYSKPYYANVIRRFKTTLGPYFFNPNNPKSFRGQIAELKSLMAREPYATAIREAELDKLHNSYDKLVCKAARWNSGLGVYIAYKVSIVMKNIRNKCNTKWRRK